MGKNSHFRSEKKNRAKKREKLQPFYDARSERLAKVMEAATGSGQSIDVQLPAFPASDRPVKRKPRLLVRDTMVVGTPTHVSMTTPVTSGVEKPKTKKVKRLERTRKVH